MSAKGAGGFFIVFLSEGHGTAGFSRQLGVIGFLIRVVMLASVFGVLLEMARDHVYIPRPLRRSRARRSQARMPFTLLDLRLEIGAFSAWKPEGIKPGERLSRGRLFFSALHGCSMIRTIVVLAVVVMLTTLVGTMLMTVGLLLPTRWCFDPAFHFWSWGILKAAGVVLEVHGAEHFRDGQTYFLVGNHQSAMDIPAMVVVTHGRVRFMAKKNLFYIPFLGWSIWLHGFVPVDRTRARQVKKEVDAMLRRLVAHPASMLVFPEGTRSEDGQVGPFKRGALQICKRAGMPVLPFAIEGSLAVHRRGSLRVRAGRVQIWLAPVIPSEEVARMETNDLVQRVRDEVMRLLADARPGSGEHSGVREGTSSLGAET